MVDKPRAAAKTSQANLNFLFLFLFIHKSHLPYS
jgi:hypothetical protein